MKINKCKKCNVIHNNSYKLRRCKTCYDDYCDYCKGKGSTYYCNFCYKHYVSKMNFIERIQLYFDSWIYG